MIALIVIVIAVAAAVLVGFGRTVRIVPQARAYVIERLGSYSRTLDAGLDTLVVTRQKSSPREYPMTRSGGRVTPAGAR